MNLMMKKIVNFYKKLGFFQGAILTLCLTSAISIATVNIPGFYTFTGGTPISATQVNSNFEKLANLIDNSRSQNYIGAWNASSNSPDIEAYSAIAGDYFIASTAGSHTFANGDALTFAVGDWAIFNGISWEKLHVTAGSSQWTTSGANIHYTTGNIGVGTTAPAAPLDVKGTLRLSGTSSGYVELKAPVSTATGSYTLPMSDGTSGQVLSTNGAGILSWITPSAGSVNSSSITDGSIVDADVNASAAIAQSKIAGLTTDLSNKQPLITAGITAQYYRGDKTFVDFGTDVRGAPLTGFAVGANSAVLATDTTLGAFQKVQGQINATNTAVAGKEPAITAGTTAQYIRGDKTLSTFATDTINSALSTFTLDAGAKPSVAAADSVVGAFGKVQKYLNDINSDYVSKSANQTINGTLAINSVTGFITVPIPVNPNDAANKQYVDSLSHWAMNAGDINRLTGRVGIGTTTPVEQLHLYSTGDTRTIVETNNMSFNAQTVYKQNTSQGNIGFMAGGDFVIQTMGMNLMKFGTQAMTRMTIGADGKVGIGTSAPTFNLEVNGSIAGIGALQTSSDLKLKKNITMIDDALEKLNSISGVYYDWRIGEFPKMKFEDHRQMGVIAQDVEKVFPEAVSQNKDGIRSVAYTMLIAPLIEGVKTLHNRLLGVEEQQDIQVREIASLKAENKMLKDYLCQKDKNAPMCE